MDLLVAPAASSASATSCLWESAYAELYFTPRMWPDFSPADLSEAVRAFRARERRFGGLLTSAGRRHRGGGAMSSVRARYGQRRSIFATLGTWLLFDASIGLNWSLVSLLSALGLGLFLRLGCGTARRQRWPACSPASSWRAGSRRRRRAPSSMRAWPSPT